MQRGLIESSGNQTNAAGGQEQSHMELDHSKRAQCAWFPTMAWCPIGNLQACMNVRKCSASLQC